MHEGAQLTYQNKFTFPKMIGKIFYFHLDLDYNFLDLHARRVVACFHRAVLHLAFRI